MAYTSRLNVQYIATASPMPVRSVCGVRYSPSAHFAPPSNAAHNTAVAMAMGKCAAINCAGRRIRHRPGRECPDGWGEHGPAPPSGELPGEDPAPRPGLGAAARLVVHLDGEEQCDGRPGTQ